MTVNRLKIELVHKFTSSIDMARLYDSSQLHKECFYKAIENNLNISGFLRGLGFSVYNEDLYKKKSRFGAISTNKKKEVRSREFTKENKEMVHIQRRHKW